MNLIRRRSGFTRTVCRGRLPASAAVFAAFFLNLAAAEDRPNILWIIAEDISPDLGCYGDAYARTPHLDRLAAEGARFTRAFSVSGVCAPSRSALITGMYPTTIGSHHMRSSALPPPYVKCFTEYLRAAGYYCSNDSKTDYNFSGDPRGVPVGAWDAIRPGARWRGREPGQPFFSVITLPVTHESRVRAPDAEFERLTAGLAPGDRHNPAQAKLPPYYPDDPEVRRDWARYHDLITIMDAQAGDILADLEADGLAANTMVIFFGDNGRGLPRGKRWVYDSGIRVPLIARWPGKIAPGSTREELVSFIDFAPTTLALAGVAIPPHLQGRVFIGQAAAPAPEFIFAARDRMDAAYDVIRAAGDGRYKLIRNFEPEKPYAQPIAYMDKMPTMRVWRRLAAEGRLTGPAALFFAPSKPLEEFYDTLEDPHEVNNLIDAREHQDRIGRMRAAIERWMAESGDLGLIPEAELLDRWRPEGKWASTAAPTIRPDGGRFDAPIEVRIACTTEGASIEYSLESDAAARWRLYAGPVRLERSGTLRVRAGRLGYRDSPVVEAAFELSR